MDMQNVSNLTIPEGEVKAIHDSNNQLLWGRVNYDTKYKGDTTQQTYSGKNLFDGSTPTTTQAASSSLSENITTISSTTTGALPYCSWEIPVVQGDVVRLSAIIKNTNGRIVRQTWNGSSWTAYVARDYIDGITTSSLEVTAGSGIDKIRFNLYSNNAVTSSATYSGYENVIITKNNSNMSYEPYVGGTASPNPDYPQDIQVVTGEQTVTVSDGNISQTYTIDLTGKNLFDGNYVHYALGRTSNYQWFSSENARSAVIPCQPNTTYTITKFDTSNRFAIADYPSYPIASDTETNGLFINNSASTATVTTHADAKYLLVYVSIDNTEPKLQVEQGDEASDYTPYYNYELCKIGNYQDYIYKSGDDWYAHKVTGKKTLTGSDGWNQQSPTHVNVLNTYIGMSGWGALQSRHMLWCNMASYTDGDVGQNNDSYTNICSPNTQATNFLMDVSKAEFPTLTDWTTFLNTNNLLVYYALATPTDTKITDSTLIGQLDAIHEWLTRYGYNATVSGNLPMIIDRTNL